MTNRAEVPPLDLADRSLDPEQEPKSDPKAAVSEPLSEGSERVEARGMEPTAVPELEPTSSSPGSPVEEAAVSDAVEREAPVVDASPVERASSVEEAASEAAEQEALPEVEASSLEGSSVEEAASEAAEREALPEVEASSLEALPVEEAASEAAEQEALPEVEALPVEAAPSEAGEPAESTPIRQVLVRVEEEGTPSEGAELEPPAAAVVRESHPWIEQTLEPQTPRGQRVSDLVQAPDLPPVEQLVGRVLANRYLVEEVEYRSDTCLCYRAYHLALDRVVALRVLPRGLGCADDDASEVRRVGRAVGELSDPHLVGTLDFGVLSDGWPYLVVEQPPGQSLAALLQAEERFVLRRVLHVGRQIARGLAAAHRAGFVHGLLNPSSVVVENPGSPAEVARVLGVGLYRACGQEPFPPHTGAFGVPFYVSPEQAGCQTVDARSDVYSLGALLHEMITGAPPFSGGSFAEVLCQHLDEEPPPPSDHLESAGALAKAMDAVVERCLRKDPAKRYSSADELVDDLASLEAAASKSRRRPMPIVKRPESTIHAPAPRSASLSAPDAKVIVEGNPVAETAASDLNSASTPSMPMSRVRQEVAPPSAAVAPRSEPSNALPDEARAGSAGLGAAIRARLAALFGR